MQGTGPAMASSEAQDYLDNDSPSGRHNKADLDKLADELGIAAGPTEEVEAVGGGAAKSEGAGATSTTGEEEDDNFDDSMPESGPVLKSSVSEGDGGAAAAAGKGEGGGGAGAARREGRRTHRASFDGYDFNTLRKVGSLRMGIHSNQGGAPQLAAARSTDAQGNKTT